MKLYGYSVDVVRDHNLKLIMHCLYEKPQSCKELSTIVGLSETAIKKNIVQLQENGLVKIYEETESIKPIGRQHIRYSVNKDFGSFLLVDFAYDNNDFSIMDTTGNVLYYGKIEPSNFIDFNELDNFAKKIKAIQISNKYDIKGIAISIPGQVDEQTGIIDYSSLFGSNNSHLINIFKKYFEDANIYVKNDLRFSVYGDSELQTRSKDTIATYIQIGLGMVSAFVKDGKIIQGINGISGEIGSIYLNDECTIHDCCAVSAIINQVNKKIECKTVDDLVNLYNTNEEVKKIVLNSAKYVAFETDVLTTSLGSNDIVFLGHITRFGQEYLDIIQEKLNKSSWFPRKVEFVSDSRLRKDGMFNVLKSNIIECIK